MPYVVLERTRRVREVQVHGSQDTVRQEEFSITLYSVYANESSAKESKYGGTHSRWNGSEYRGLMAVGVVSLPSLMWEMGTDLP